MVGNIIGYGINYIMAKIYQRNNEIYKRYSNDINLCSNRWLCAMGNGGGHLVLQSRNCYAIDIIMTKCKMAS
jgi:hypothetical protein